MIRVLPAAAQRTSPDIALLDVQMPGRDGLTVAADLQRALPGCRTIIRTTFSRPGSPAEVPVTEEEVQAVAAEAALDGMEPVMVARLLKAFGLFPGRSRECISVGRELAHREAGQWQHGNAGGGEADTGCRSRPDW